LLGLLEKNIMSFLKTRIELVFSNNLDLLVKGGWKKYIFPKWWCKMVIYNGFESVKKQPTIQIQEKFV